MAQELVNFRLDSETKKEMREICEQLGMSMSTAFSIFAKAVVAERGIPFKVKINEDDSFYSKKNMAALDASIAEGERGEHIFMSNDELQKIIHG